MLKLNSYSTFDKVVKILDFQMNIIHGVYPSIKDELVEWVELISFSDRSEEELLLTPRRYLQCISMVDDWKFTTVNSINKFNEYEVA